MKVCGSLFIQVGAGRKYQIREVIKLGEIRLERFWCIYIHQTMMCTTCE